MEQADADYVDDAGEDESDESMKRKFRAETREINSLPVALYNYLSYFLSYLAVPWKE